MPSDPERSHSRQLLVLALLVLAVSTAWSIRTAPAPNSDRYDYLGRAHHVLTDGTASPLVVYPLRFAFDGAQSWPVENISRPPLWPVLVAGGLRIGAGDAAGVLVGATGMLCLLLLVASVGDRSFGAGAGGFAALVVATSFASVRAIWGGGPEPALAALVYVLWSWSPAARGRAGYVVAGLTYGLLPWLHPVGALYAILAFVARNHRYSLRGRVWIGALALVVALPWYVKVGTTTQVPLAPLQTHAELAKSVLDPAGMGPYRTLEPVSAGELIREEPERVLRAWSRNARDLVLHLDAWLAWPMVLLGLWGARRDSRLALADGASIAVAFGAVAIVARDPRLLLPVLAIAATWCGAGWQTWTRDHPRWRSAPLAFLVLLASWLLPLGASSRPGQELRALPSSQRQPPTEVARAIGAVGNPRAPIFTDQAVLAWKSRRPAVLLPSSPATLRELRRRPVLAETDRLVLGGWRRSSRLDPWRSAHVAAWDSLLQSCRSDTVGIGDARVIIFDLGDR